MMCNICHREYSSPSFGGPGVCPACDCGMQPDTVRVRELEAVLRRAETVMMIVEPRSHKAEYLETLHAIRTALGYTSQRDSQP